MLKPAASTGSLAQPNLEEEVIPSLHIPGPQNAVSLVLNYGGGSVATKRRRSAVMSGRKRVCALNSPTSATRSGLAKTSRGCRGIGPDMTNR